MVADHLKLSELGCIGCKDDWMSVLMIIPEAPDAFRRLTINRGMHPRPPLDVVRNRGIQSAGIFSFTHNSCIHVPSTHVLLPASS